MEYCILRNCLGSDCVPVKVAECDDADLYSDVHTPKMAVMSACKSLHEHPIPALAESLSVCTQQTSSAFEQQGNNKSPVKAVSKVHLQGQLM